MSLAGKHVLITGGSRGIGRGIALKLAENGAKIAVHYYQNARAANDTLGQIRKHGSDGLVIQADVTRPEQITDMVRKVRAEFGTLDIFVSNARPEVPAFFRPPMDITLEQWDAAFDSQAKAFLVGVREAVVSMGRAGESSPSLTRRGVVRVACCRGSAWVRQRQRLSRSFATSLWPSPNAASQ